VDGAIVRRLVSILAGLAALSVLLIPATGRAGGAGHAAAPAAPSQAGQQLTEQEQAGRALYLTNCASCHGANFNGVPGNGPTLRDVGGAAAVEYVLTTGRMPLSAPDQIPVRKPPIFDQQEINSIVAYVGRQVGDTYVPRATTSTDQQTLFRGRDLYLNNCAACHGANGAGAAIGGGYDAPSLYPVQADTVAQAMYIGPSKMPRFTGQGWSQREVDEVASYVLTLGTRNVDRGGLPIGGRGPVAEGFVAWIIGLGLLVLASRLIGTRSPVVHGPPIATPPATRPETAGPETHRQEGGGQAGGQAGGQGGEHRDERGGRP
jgi:ubiquinol-cytochrome c reductase cytochrome c subunit